MKLTEQLLELVKESSSRIPADIKKIMLQANLDLSETGIRENIVSVGEIFPKATLEDSQGNEVDLNKTLANTMSVITFYRGGWCPYCNLELKSYQERLSEFQKLWVQIIAISPEKPEIATQTIQKDAISFPVLSDVWNILAKKLKLSFNLKDAIIDIYKKFGIDVEKHNGDTLFELPLPATYIVDKNGKIIFAQADTDYTKRTDPDEILEILKKL